MLSRRLIRIKAFKILFGKTVVSEGDAVVKARNELLESCQKSVELYALLLSLPVALKRVAEERIEVGLQKFNPTPEESAPNRKFVENAFISLLESDASLNKYLKAKALNWKDGEDVVKEIYRTLKGRDYFKAYMEAPANVDEDARMAEDKALIRKFFENEIEDNASLHDFLMERSIHWSDDVEYVTNQILNNLSKIAKSGTVSIPNAFAKQEDEDFAVKLLTKSRINYDDYAEEISKKLSNWEFDRLLSTDVALVVMGLTEAQNFDDIPLKVTINEYVDIANFYNSGAHNSGSFVNGLLDKMIKKMVDEGAVVKSGRGLVGGFK